MMKIRGTRSPFSPWCCYYAAPGVPARHGRDWKDIGRLQSISMPSGIFSRSVDDSPVRYTQPCGLILCYNLINNTPKFISHLTLDARVDKTE